MVIHETTISTGVTANASRPLGEWGRAAAVLEARRETYTPENEVDPTMSGVPARRLVGVAGGELDLRWRRLDLHVIPSARVELMSDVVTGTDSNGVVLPATAVFRALPIYRLGLVRPLNESATLKGNLGRYARAPSFIELYGNGNYRLLGDPGLLPERGTNADLALWIDRAGPWGALLSRTTVFGALTNDLIYWLRSLGGSSRAENLASARVYGVEQELRATLGRHLRLVGQGTITVAEDESELAASHGKQIAYHPRYMAYGRPGADTRVPSLRGSSSGPMSTRRCSRGPSQSRRGAAHPVAAVARSGTEPALAARPAEGHPQRAEPGRLADHLDRQRPAASGAHAVPGACL